MKYKVLLFIAMLFSTFAVAQLSRDTTKCIEVSGYSELEVEPDMVYLSIQVKEYNAITKQKIKLETQETELFKILADLEIKSENLKIDKFTSYQYKAKWRESDVAQNKEYLLKITDMSKLNTFYDKLSNSTVNCTSINIRKTDNSKLNDFKKQVYEKAMIDAYEKAQILLKPLKRKVGKPILVTEYSQSISNNRQNSSVDEMLQGQATGVQVVWGSRRSSSYNYSSNYQDISVRDIQLSYKINVKFEIE